MKILLVHPGATMATADVFAGLRDGLTARGHEILEYELDNRIQVASGYLHWLWNKGKRQPDLKPRDGQVLYRAGAELVERALRVQPDVVFVVSAMYLHPDVLVLLHRAGLKVALLLTESPYDDEKQAKLIPWVRVAWTHERSSARRMRIGYLPHAWKADVHRPSVAESNVPAHQVLFVGTAFQERIDLLSAVDWTGIDLALYGSWEVLGSRNPLRAFVKGRAIDNRVTAALYRKATIGLNIYRTSQGFGKDVPRITGAESLNPRAYELAATGCFTISDRRPEVTERFGDLVPTFSSAEDLRALLDRWLADDAGRRAIQAALPQTVATETWDARAQQVEQDLIGAGIGARHEPQPAIAGLAHVAGG